MMGFSLVLAVQMAVIAADPSAYEAAFKEAQQRDRPLLVLVGAPWCPGCQTMKQTLLPSMARRGRLNSVSYATVDADAEPELASQLMRGSAIPQLIVFSKKAGGQWQREQIIGEAAEKDVQALINKALATHERLAQAAGGGN